MNLKAQVRSIIGDTRRSTGRHARQMQKNRPHRAAPPGRWSVINRTPEGNDIRGIIP